MTFRGTFLDGVVLSLMLIGAFWMHSRGRVGESSKPESRDGAALATVNAAPDLTLGRAQAAAGDVRLLLEVSPTPPRALHELVFLVRAEAGGQIVPIDGGQIAFDMSMPMGNHRYALAASDGSARQAEVVLPPCMSGNTEWFATVDAHVKGKPVSARFRFALAPAEAAATP